MTSAVEVKLKARKDTSSIEMIVFIVVPKQLDRNFVILEKIKNMRIVYWLMVHLHISEIRPEIRVEIPSVFMV